MLNLIAMTVLALGLPGAPAHARMKIASPAHGARIASDPSRADPVWLEVQGCKGKASKVALRVTIDGKPRPDILLKRLPYRRAWGAEASLGGPGQHWIHVSGFCPKASSASARVRTEAMDTRASAFGLATRYILENPSEKADWDWEDAIFLYGAQRLAAQAPGLPGARLLDEYVRTFHHRWNERGLPRINRPERVSPALSALALADAGDPAGRVAADRALAYVRSAPRNGLDAIDHLGRTVRGKLYPRSIWVESPMMYAVFAAQAARRLGDPALLDWAARQPGIFAAALRDDRTGLFRHAYWYKSRKLFPKGDAYWLRGNGWALVAMAEILDELPEEHPRWRELRADLERTALGLAAYTLASGAWDSVANRPGASYPETSGTLLVSYAMAKAARRGWIDPSYMEIAKRAFAWASGLLSPKGGHGGLSLPYVSIPTFPMRLEDAYGWVPWVRDTGYGVGAYLLAASELWEPALLGATSASRPAPSW